MDPPAVFTLLTAVGSSVVQLRGGPVAIHAMTAADKAEVKGTQNRSAVFLMAKKAVKAERALAELDIAFKAMETPGLTPINNTPVTDSTERSLAIVPYRAVPLNRANLRAADGKQDFWRQAYASIGISDIVSHYLWVCKCSVRVLLYLPIFVIIALTFYGILLGLYVLSQPRTVATASVAVANLPPKFAAWWVGELWDQVKSELSAMAWR